MPTFWSCRLFAGPQISPSLAESSERHSPVEVGIIRMVFSELPAKPGKEKMRRKRLFRTPRLRQTLRNSRWFRPFQPLCRTTAVSHQSNRPTSVQPTSGCLIEEPLITPNLSGRERFQQESPRKKSA
jgi:hypothetical protein